MDIFTLKTIAGEEIISELINGGDDQLYYLKKPRQILIDNANRQIIYMPLLQSVDDDEILTINKNAVLINPVKTHASLAQQYKAETSELELPKSEILLG